MQLQAVASASCAGARGCRRASRRASVVVRASSIKSVRRDVAGERCAPQASHEREVQRLAERRRPTRRLLVKCRTRSRGTPLFRYRETFQVSLLGLEGGKATVQELTAGPATVLVPLVVPRPLGIIFEERRVALNAPAVCVVDEVTPGRFVAAARRTSRSRAHSPFAATPTRRACASETCCACARAWLSSARRRIR